MNGANGGNGSESGLPPVGFDERTTPFLSQGPPRSGEISTFAQKLLGECFVWLCSMVVFGSTVNLLISKEGQCNHLCGYAIATSVISVIITSFLLFGHWLTWSSKLDRGSWFNSNTEKNFMGFLMFWWAVGVGGLSAVMMEEVTTEMWKPVANAVNKTVGNLTTTTCALIKVPDKVVAVHASDVGIFFGWLAFFGSIYTTFKAFHTSKEEQRTLAYSSHPYNFAQGNPEEEDHYANF